MTDLHRIELDERAAHPAGEWTLLAAGDFCAYQRFAYESDLRDAANKAVAEELQALIAGADLSIVNMEGPVSTSCSPIRKSGPSIQLDAAVPSVLKQIGFSAVSLANNHIMDYGAQALERTMEECESAGLLVCGAGGDLDEAMKPIERVIAGGIRVSILAFCEREFGVAERARPGSAWISHPLALKRVAEVARTVDVVIVVAHGGVEDVPFPPVQHQAQLRQLIDAGATLVVGHHPHVPQGWERYNKGLILYSLGNFLFDHPGVAGYPKRSWGLVVLARFRGPVLSGVELVPVEMLSDGRIGSLGEVRDLEASLGYLHRLSDILADVDILLPYWQETAVHLWSTKYRAWLQDACATSTSPRSDSIGAHLTALYRVVRESVRRRFRGVGSVLPQDMRDSLLLLNTVRNESHRWTVETALAVLHGDEVDRRTPEVQAEVRKLLAWTEG